MSWFVCAMLLLALLAGFFTGRADALSAAAMEGAQTALTLCISMAGPICLWSGVGEAMQRSGLAALAARACGPLLRRLFPTAYGDPETAGYLSANFTANLLGLGNAATPMGLAATVRMANGETASDEVCRLIVLNTASVQLIPTTVAALRASLGAAQPFDLLPAVWLSSLCSVSAGLLAARLLERRWRS